jgi:hypothetical protein
MEQQKRLKPLFSQAVERLARLIERIFWIDNPGEESVIERDEESSQNRSLMRSENLNSNDQSSTI